MLGTEMAAAITAMEPLAIASLGMNCATGPQEMSEHVHLLVSEPLDHETPLSKALQSLKVSVSKRLGPRPFWQARYYDFNVFTHNKRVEELKYMHRNPVTRGLVERPEDWSWSSYHHYLLDEPGPVGISRL